MAAIRLGLIGDNIARSRSPRLHVEAGRLCGLDVTYERLIPRDLGLEFEAVFDWCASAGFRGINVTYPYKEEVVPRVSMQDPVTAKIGACNTILYDGLQPQGHNTDYTGFVSAFRAAFGDSGPGVVAMAGAGGVGKAIAFALARLGARELRIFDTDTRKADELASALVAAQVAMNVASMPSISAATNGADGLVNCTPLGMDGHPGTAMEGDSFRGAAWAFDAVYTPVETRFLRLALDAGLAVMSGYELFFHQGIDAFRHFTGQEVDATELRNALGAVGLEKLDA
ncbi:shikimate dehydrogenase family protein [Chelativorans alearense]|uniref:shikimate dehydrogenase family protein n=1 Tax=Chelativorans alearense TaxID=2681495 RepID=UPI0013D3BC36|nr:shikimate dehydrogenase [Chelativorans alearense]